MDIIVIKLLHRCFILIENKKIKYTIKQVQFGASDWIYIFVLEYNHWSVWESVNDSTAVCISILHSCHLQSSPSSHQPPPNVFLPHWTSAEVLINASLSHMQMPLWTPFILISFCELLRIRNIPDALPKCSHLSTSECIKYCTSIHTHSPTHTPPPALPPYLYSSRHHQWITFMQNASITRKTKRPCQGGSCHRRRQTIPCGAHLSCNQPIIWVYIRPLWHGNFLLLCSHFQRQ